MNSAAHPSAALVEHALSLLAAAAIETPVVAAGLREQLETWRAQSAEHALAYTQALRQWQALDAVAPALRSHFVEPKRKRRTSRTRSTLAVLAFVSCLSGLLGWHLSQPLLEQTAQTGVAQLAQIPLPDGSRIDVNAGSVLQLAFYRNRRLVELKRGEARFEVASDADRPFRVQTRSGTVEVVGTVFVVADRGDAITVDVERGRVRFLPLNPASSIELSGGERVVVRDGVPGRVENVGNREFAPWRDGWLMFDNEQLVDALPAINAFRKSPLVLADESAGTLRLTGRFRANDMHGLLAALPRVLPVEVVDRADGTVSIRSR
jgi:transmembrane sensor